MPNGTCRLTVQNGDGNGTDEVRGYEVFLNGERVVSMHRSGNAEAPVKVLSNNALEVALTGVSFRKVFVEVLCDAAAGGSLGDKEALLTAAWLGDLSAVKQLLRGGAPIDQRDGDSGKTALHYAAQSKNVELVRFLIQKGADVNARAYGNVTPLMLSVDMAFGQPDIALELIRADADVSVADANGDTALLIATTESSDDVVHALLERGANPNARGLNGETALHYAAMNAFVERVELLIRYGADPSIHDSSGKSAIEVAQTTNPDATVREQFAKTRSVLLAASQQKSK